MNHLIVDYSLSWSAYVSVQWEKSWDVFAAVNSSRPVFTVQSAVNAAMDMSVERKP